MTKGEINAKITMEQNKLNDMISKLTIENNKLQYVMIRLQESKLKKLKELLDSMSNH